VGNGVLGEERRLQADFGADPFAFVVRSIGRVIAASAAAELRAEVGALDFIVLTNLAPGLVAYGARDVNYESDDGHRKGKAAADYADFTDKPKS
jgi:hypothetical protein